ncbi:MAG TPA: dTMP kinase [Firmicutes bacterium]|jgi:dTMP kinase|nr:dTMP kinase [Bacillota bacterium]HOQ24307.1 dTMP kinase [Bacillota bacterium]HPT67468.1 dTMP kinase [Bacillota bacterium]
MAGIFITFEGIDGCGKSTQVRLFTDWLVKQGKPVLVTREPGGTPLAERIRRVLLEPVEEEVYPLTEILLYAASRAQHVAGQIGPALAAGKIVICERFVDSTFAYQGYGLGYDLALIKELNHVATGGLVPDWTLLMDLPPELAAARLHGRAGGEDRIEARGLAFQGRVRDGYLRLAADHPKRIHRIDLGDRGVEAIQCEIQRAFQCRFPDLLG